VHLALVSASLLASPSGAAAVHVEHCQSDLASFATPAGWSQVFPTRMVPAEFEQFEREVLCAAAKPAVRGPVRLVVDDSPEVIDSFRTCSLSEIRREIFGWVSVLADAPVHEHRRMEAMATADLLGRADVQCSYRMPPALLMQARPVVVVQLEVLEAVGRIRFLRALWESEVAVGAAGSDREYGALFDELGDRFGVRAARAAQDRKERTP